MPSTVQRVLAQLTLDRLPAPVRHAVLIFAAAFASVLVGAYYQQLQACGLSCLGQVDAGHALLSALETGIAATVAGSGILGLTPATLQYGARWGLPASIPTTPIPLPPVPPADPPVPTYSTPPTPPAPDATGSLPTTTGGL